MGGKGERAMMKFEVFKGSDGQYYFHLKSSNGQKIVQSEGYSRKEHAMGAIESIKSGATTASVVDLTK
jgi:uncharacterized protein